MPNKHQDEVYIAANLKRLCALFSSVSDVSRRLGINRQQFNKYLSGTSFPSLRNLRRITDFFGVDEFEIMLPPDQFVATVLPQRANTLKATSGTGDIFASGNKPSQKILENYCGFYFVYFYTPVWSTHIVRALTQIYQVEGRTVTRTIERLRDVSIQGKRGPVQKFRGNVSHLVDRIGILEYETTVEEPASMIFLYPSRRQALHLLTGVMVGVASGGSRQPFAARVVYEFLGQKIDGRKVLGACGLFSPDGGGISEEIRARVLNTLAPGESVLLPRAY